MVSWAAIRRIEMEETGTEQMHPASLGVAIEASDGSAEDVEEDITECSTSLVMDVLHTTVITANPEVGSHRNTGTLNMSFVCPWSYLSSLPLQSRTDYRARGAHQSETTPKTCLKLHNGETNKSSNPSKKSSAGIVRCVVERRVSHQICRYHVNGTLRHSPVCRPRDGEC